MLRRPSRTPDLSRASLSPVLARAAVAPVVAEARLQVEREARYRRALAALHAADAAAFAWNAQQRRLPLLDRALLKLTHSCDNGALWFGLTAGIALFGGKRGRLAAALGISSLGITSPLINGPVKWLVRRQRPDVALVPEWRRLRTHPRTSSFPSGHAASAWSYAVAASAAWPTLSIGLVPMAAAVGWSRVHTGAHYPGDVLAGSLAGAALGAGYAAWAPRVIPPAIPRLLRIG